MRVRTRVPFSMRTWIVKTPVNHKLYLNGTLLNEGGRYVDYIRHDTCIHFYFFLKKNDELFLTFENV